MVAAMQKEPDRDVGQSFDLSGLLLICIRLGHGDENRCSISRALPLPGLH